LAGVCGWGVGKAVEASAMEMKATNANRARCIRGIILEIE